jgi:prepilin-type N-terminal cleavage/methylation domain-containing protein
MGHPPGRRWAVQTRSSNGFTLLEVAIALAILAIAFTAFSTLQARNLTLTAENKGVTQATLGARDILARLQSDLLPLEDSEGEIGDHAPGWLWQLRVKEATVEGLQNVQLVVYRDGEQVEQGDTFRFLLKTPPEEEP